MIFAHLKETISSYIYALYHKDIDKLFDITISFVNETKKNNNDHSFMLTDLYIFFSNCYRNVQNVATFANVHL